MLIVASRPEITIWFSAGPVRVEAPVVRLDEPCRGVDGAHRPLPRRQGADHDRDPESASGRIGTFTTLVTLLGGTTVHLGLLLRSSRASDAGPAYTVLAPLPRVCSVLIGRPQRR